MKKHRNGFTIIEVSLVIAIAGLIFLMVFTALPQLQRQRRDTERREDVLALIKEIKRYQENNRGALPEWNTTSQTIVIYGNSPNQSSWGKFYNEYLGSNFTDPSGSSYNLGIMKCDYDSSTNIGSECPGYKGQGGRWSPTTLTEHNFPNEYFIYVVLQATCDGNTAVKTSNPRSVSALYRLEGAGVYCANT